VTRASRLSWLASMHPRDVTTTQPSPRITVASLACARGDTPTIPDLSFRGPLPPRMPLLAPHIVPDTERFVDYVAADLTSDPRRDAEPSGEYPIEEVESLPLYQQLVRRGA
jgi:hypothetical protein